MMDFLKRLLTPTPAPKRRKIFPNASDIEPLEMQSLDNKHEITEPDNVTPNKYTYKRRSYNSLKEDHDLFNGSRKEWEQNITSIPAMRRTLYISIKEEIDKAIADKSLQNVSFYELHVPWKAEGQSNIDYIKVIHYPESIKAVCLRGKYCGEPLYPRYHYSLKEIRELPDTVKKMINGAIFSHYTPSQEEELSDKSKWVLYHYSTSFHMNAAELSKKSGKPKKTIQNYHKPITELSEKLFNTTFSGAPSASHYWREMGMYIPTIKYWPY